MFHNLNSIRLAGESHAQSNFGVSSGTTECVFRDVKERLIEIIRLHAGKTVVGCVAWLTDSNILKALEEVECSIIVQKEDFLRPDIQGSVSTVRQSYDRLKEFHWHVSWTDGIALKCDEYNISSEPEKGAVRCVGNHNSNKCPVFPRMHNKFLVFCDWIVNPNWTCSCDKDATTGATFSEHEYTCEQQRVRFEATSVWTGSLNLTHNAERSFENAVYIQDTVIAHAYLNEWSQILGLSEPLDWTDPWVAPEFRIGT